MQTAYALYNVEVSIQQHRPCLKTFLPASPDLFHKEIFLHHSWAPHDPPSFPVICASFGPTVHASRVLLADPALLGTAALLLSHSDPTARCGSFERISPSLIRFTDALALPYAGPHGSSPLMTEGSHFGQAGGVFWICGAGSLASHPQLITIPARPWNSRWRPGGWGARLCCGGQVFPAGVWHKHFWWAGFTPRGNT